MTVRPATYDDIPRLLEIYGAARDIQLSIGDLHQWKPGYPDEATVRSDIARGVGHVVEDGGLVVGAFACIPGEDPTYTVIEGGAWLDDSRPYLTIHRLAGMKGRHGVARTCFDWCWGRLHNLRIDTHEDNSVMRHCIMKAGFSYCGIIHLLDGDPRFAYQKVGE